jgi:hypothetical protein
MDDAEYRRLCAAPDVMKREHILSTEARLRRTAPHLDDLLVRVLAGDTVPRPQRHDGTRDDDFLYLDLAPEEIEAIHDELRDEETRYAMQETMLGDASAGFVSRLADLWLSAESVRPQAS